MASDYDNDDVACYFTTKHSWRGKYKRVFSIGSKAITTYNPSNFEVTNQWVYHDFINIVPSSKTPNELTIVVRKAKEGKKTQNMTFSTEHRVDLLTDALKFYKGFAGYKSGNELRFSGYKLHWSERKVPVTLEVSPGSLDQIDVTTNKKLCSYSYKDIELIALHKGAVSSHMCLIFKVKGKRRHTEIIDSVCVSVGELFSGNKYACRWLEMENGGSIHLTLTCDCIEDVPEQRPSSRMSLRR